jgi:hypothetical protein
MGPVRQPAVFACSAALALAVGLSCSGEEPASPPLSAEALEAEAVGFDGEELLEAPGYVASEPVHSSTGVVHHDRAGAHQGWNLYVSQHGQEARLMDMDGETLHVWKGSPRETEMPRKRRMGLAPWWRTVHPFPNGEILAQTDSGSLARLDRDSKILWVFQDRTHHDFDVRDDGHVFVLARSLGKFPILGGWIVNDFIVELDPGGTELRRLSIAQSLIDSGAKQILDELVEFRRGAKGAARRDPLHTNSVEILDGSLAGQLPAFARGNLLISLPMIGRVAVVDFDAGRVVWSLRGSFRSQHDPTMLANGHMLIFDNKGLGGERSRILEIDPVTGEEVWFYGAEESETFYSECCGRVYRLANGNTLVVDSKSARAFEVDPSGTLVWEFRSPHESMGKAAILNDMLRLPHGSVSAQDAGLRTDRLSPSGFPQR